DNAAREANTDGVVTAEEAAAVETANQELAAAKAAAKEAINARPDEQRAGKNGKKAGRTGANVHTIYDKKPAKGEQDEIDEKNRRKTDKQHKLGQQLTTITLQMGYKIKWRKKTRHRLMRKPKQIMRRVKLTPMVW